MDALKFTRSCEKRIIIFWPSPWVSARPLNPTRNLSLPDDSELGARSKSKIRIKSKNRNHRKFVTGSSAA
jgi:hypothetical protein